MSCYKRKDEKMTKRHLGADAQASESGKESGKESGTGEASQSSPKKRRRSGGEKYTFFWGKASPFSQFYPCSFHVGGNTFSCAEQWMMHRKAVHFGNFDVAEEIMRCQDPKGMKAFGRRVKGFTDVEWDKVKVDIVREGTIEKFTQNPSLKRHLFDTQGTVLAEASPFDRIWGIGLSSKSPKALERETWQGSNLLGYVITEVREMLLEREPRESVRPVEFEWKSWREKCRRAAGRRTDASGQQRDRAEDVGERRKDGGSSPSVRDQGNAKPAPTPARDSKKKSKKKKKQKNH